MQSLNKSVRYTYQLLENLLEWSRSQQNRIPFNPRNIDLYDIAYESLMLSEHLAKKKSITIENNVQKKEIICVDVEMINTIFRNLITNAIKFTPENGTITISSKRSLQTIEIKVSDTGTGMDMKTKNTLFKIGKTKSVEGTSGERGTGLGLLICKEFIEKHGGQIRVESEVGKGTDFKFTLPLENKNKDDRN